MRRGIHSAITGLIDQLIKKRLAETGSFAAAPTGGVFKSKAVEAHKDWLLAALEAALDLTLAEIQARMKATPWASLSVTRRPKPVGDILMLRTRGHSDVWLTSGAREIVRKTDSWYTRPVAHDDLRGQARRGITEHAQAQKHVVEQRLDALFLCPSQFRGGRGHPRWHTGPVPHGTG